MRAACHLLILGLLCSLPCDGDAAHLRPQQPQPPAFHNRFIVKWRRSAAVADAAGFAAHVHAASGRTRVRMSGLRHDAHSRQSIVQLAGYTPRTLPAERAALLRAVAADPAVQYIVEDRILYPSLAPNDPMYSSQWHYGPVVSGGVYPSGLTYGMNLPDAWARTTGAASPVAVVDTGITAHPDLDAKVLPGYDMISPDSPGVFTKANDGDGRDSDPSDPGDWTSTSSSSWHGTHVSGTIGAATNNNVGVAGVSWGAKILPVRALGVGGGFDSDINDGVRWAAGLPVDGVPANANPARVINLSLGGNGACDAASQEAIDAAIGAGAIVVVAAGNSNADTTNTSPCNCQKVICVAAHGPSGQRAVYSNFGAAVDITAPGGDSDLGDDTYSVLSTLNSGTTVPAAPTYGALDGTSMATPHVSGLISLMLSLNANLTWEPVESILKLTARSFPAPNVPPRACSLTTCGAGLADAAAALAFVAAMPANDRCEAAVAVACGQTVQGSVQNATALSADPQCGGTVQTTADVWYSLQLTNAAALQLFTNNSNTNFDTQINVYSGSSCSNLQCVAGNDNAAAGEARSYLAFAATAGSWLIRVSGAAQARGAFALTVACPGSGLVGGGAAASPGASPLPSPSPSPSPSPTSSGSPSPPASGQPSATPSPSGGASPSSISLASMSPAIPGASPASMSPASQGASPTSLSPASMSPASPGASPASMSPVSQGASPTSLSPASMSPASPGNSQSSSPSASPRTSQSSSPGVSPSISRSASPIFSPSTSPSAGQSASPKASPSMSPSAGQSASPKASPSPIQSTSQNISPIASPSPSPRTSPSPSPIVPSPSPSPVNQNSFETATNPNTPIAAFGGTPVVGQEVAKAIDGTTTAYSNQGGPGSGFGVTLANPVALTALRIFTSNESASRDPSSYELFGSNDNSVLVSGRRANVSSAWVLIASGNVTLPAARNAPGLQVTTALNFLLVRFSNTQAYANYLVVFPTLAGSGTSRAGTSTMSVSEVQLLRGSTSSNNDNSGLLGLLALLVLPVIILAALAWYTLTHREASAKEWPAPDPFTAAGPSWSSPAVSAPLSPPTRLYGGGSDLYSWSTPVIPTTPQFEPFSIPRPAPWPADTEVEW